ncbi:hypothetical protein CROQUDRAFT_85773 [Cronartium quercuum f. sp. fusiforme G11]|uniref:ELMO domain-containing protein n=1 Tax=Cronartium quercuum f. sp. fusiforme G11 TaxID=708437 RepID=A0A9P6THT6_9BASI|nr:hypothetical protein CROQUDRAFT_85773 [Cronartium quercuum f. sp. fusiforme G11]
MPLKLPSRPIQPTSYWAQLVFQFSVPTFIDAWRQKISNSPYSALLLTIHRSIKFIYKCICLICSSSRTNSSEIGRALTIAHTSRILTFTSDYRDNPEANECDMVSERVEGDGISNTWAIWRIDWALRHSKTLMNEKVTLETGSTEVEDVALAIMSVKSIDPVLSPTLISCLNRIRAANRSIQMILERINTPYNPETDAPRLKELWHLLKPNKPLDSLHTKAWQEIGFQGCDPATDFRGSASLGLDALIHFGKRYGKAAQALVEEAVDGGPSWYPWALASINITWWCVSLAKQHNLQYFFLLSSGDVQPFLVLQTRLTLLFHSYWRRLEPAPNVMEFEEKFKCFKCVVGQGLIKGLVGGPGVGWIGEVEPAVVSAS